MSPSWGGSGPKFEAEWGGRVWVLDMDDTGPGLMVRGGMIGPLLRLEGLAAEGRSDPEAVSSTALDSFTSHAERLATVYLPPSWPGLTVRASWVISGDDAVDLEIEVTLSTTASETLRGFEVTLSSVLPEPAGSRPKRWVEPRDMRSAGLSYDGREADVRGLTTLPPAEEESLVPRVLPSPWEDGLSYVEIVHAKHVSRRIVEAGKISSLGHTTRYGLFGVDLAPGDIVRTRVRGLWLLSASPQREAIERAEAFQNETT